MLLVIIHYNVFNFTFSSTAEKNPLKLKEICRSVIRVLLRANAEAENPSLRDKKKLVPSRRKKNRRRIRKVVIPVFDDRSESGDNRNTSSNEHADDEMDPRTNGRRQEHVSEELICSEHSVRLSECGCEIDKAVNDIKDADENTETTNPDNGRRASSLDDANEKPCSSHFKGRRSSAEDPVYKKDDLFNMVVKTVIVQNQIPNDPVAIQNHNTNNQVEAMDTSDVPSEVSAVDPASTDITTNGHSDRIPDAEITDKDFSEINILTNVVVPVDASTSNTTTTDFSAASAMAADVSCINPALTGESKVSESETKNNFGVHHIVNGIANGDSGIDNISDDSVPEESSSDPEKTEGENGLADISASRTDCSDDNEADRRLTRLSTYLKRSAEENDDEGPYVPRIGGESRITAKCCRKAVVFKRIAYSDVDSDDFDDFESDSGKESYPKDYEGTREKSDLSCYTCHMKQKISMLPLPQYLKMYLNFSRPI